MNKMRTRSYFRSVRCSVVGVPEVLRSTEGPLEGLCSESFFSGDVWTTQADPCVVSNFSASGLHFMAAQQTVQHH